MKILLLFLCGLMPLYANIEQHFKKAEGKGNYHQMKNIDFIYMLNLDQRSEKFARSAQQLNLYGIHPYRFSAVNGWELSHETINDVGLKFTSGMTQKKLGTCYSNESWEPIHKTPEDDGNTYFGHSLSRGAIGIVLSHLSILQDAYDSGYETIWVMEDDVEIIRNPNTLSDLIKKLDKAVGKKEWDILFTDKNTKDANGDYVPCGDFAWRPNFKPKDKSIFRKRKNIDKDFRKIGARFGAYSMIVRRSGMKKILDFIKTHKVYLPFDLDYFQVPNIHLYVLRNDVVSTLPKAISDNGVANYLSKGNQ